MLEASGVAAVLDWDALPLFDGVLDLSRDFCRPGKTFGLIEWAGAFTSLAGLDDAELDARMGVLCDPQTSGGLLAAVPSDAEGRVRRGVPERAGARALQGWPRGQRRTRDHRGALSRRFASSAAFWQPSFSQRRLARPPPAPAFGAPL